MLGLFPDETQDAYEAVKRLGPGTPDKAGFLSGIPIGIATGVAEGEVKLGETFAGVAASGLRTLQHAALAPGAASEFAEQTGLAELDPDEVEARIRNNSQELLRKVKPDPMTVGYAGQVLHGIASVGTRAVAGGGVAGLPGAVATAAGTEGYTTSEDFQAQGVDKNTAHVLGVGSALMTGAGLGMPGVAGVGTTLAGRVVSGAAVNTLMGAADRAAMHTVLADRGYDAMAAQYRVMDGQALMVDAILGGVFGAQGYLHGKVAPSTVDAAHAANEGLHAENDLAPGAAVSPEQRDLHMENLVRTTQALLNGDDVPPMSMPDTISNPAQEALRTTNAAEVADAQGELLGANGLRPERRQDAIEDARLAELRQVRLSGRPLTADELSEYAGLLESNRLSAKVGGRRMPGVLNMDAYAEAHARNELQPAQGFADLDMLKALNDTLGHQAGDEAIHAFGQELSHYFGEGNVFHRGGDEFVVQSGSPEAHNAAMDAIRQRLDNYVIRAYKGDQVVEQKGVKFSHGTGKTAELAEQAAYADKQARLAAGLRTERGSDVRPVAEKPGANRPAGGNPAAWAKAAGKVTTPTQAVSRLSEALKRLVQTDGKDANAHEAARAILARSADAGWDTKSIGDSAVRRAGTGAESALQGAALRDQPPAETGGLDPETRESVDRAQSIIERNANLAVASPDSGLAVNAHDALNQALDELKGAKAEGELVKVAAACFGRG